MIKEFCIEFAIRVQIISNRLFIKKFVNKIGVRLNFQSIDNQIPHTEDPSKTNSLWQTSLGRKFFLDWVARALELFIAQRSKEIYLSHSGRVERSCSSQVIMLLRHSQSSSVSDFVPFSVEISVPEHITALTE